MMTPMGAQDYDDTDMTSEEFERAMMSGVDAVVSNAGGPVGGVSPRTGSSAVTHEETVQFVRRRDETITGRLELAGT